MMNTIRKDKFNMALKKNLLLAAAVLGTALPAFAQGEPPPPYVSVEKAVIRNDAATRKYVGHIEAIQSVSIVARISGYLYEIKFKEGELVKKGQLLFVIEDTTYRAKAKSAEASVMQIQAELEYAQNDFNRQEKLYQKRAVAEIVYQDAKRLFNTTKAKLAEAEANLLDANNSLSYTKIYAPITGIIGKATYTEGNYVTPTSKELADIVQVTPIYVRFAISERDFIKEFGSVEGIRKNGIVQILLADGREYSKTGNIVLVDNKVDNETGTITLWAQFDNPDHVLVPGGYTTVKLSRKLAVPTPAVKLSAMMTDDKGNYIYIVDKEGKAELRRVKPGTVIGSMQLIESGVKPGETVVVDGTHKVRPGGKVVPVFEKQETK